MLLDILGDAKAVVRIPESLAAANPAPIRPPSGRIWSDDAPPGSFQPAARRAITQRASRSGRSRSAGILRGRARSAHCDGNRCSVLSQGGADPGAAPTGSREHPYYPCPRHRPRCPDLQHALLMTTDSRHRERVPFRLSVVQMLASIPQISCDGTIWSDNLQCRSVGVRHASCLP